MKRNKSILWITRTAISLALLVTAQIVLKALGQLVLGSVVNLILIATTMLIGISEGITIAILSPFLAFLLGFGPAVPQIVPVVMLGNVTIVLIWYLIAGRIDVIEKTTFVRFSIALIIAAVTKFLVLWLGVVKVVVPLLNIQNPQATVLSTAFSFPQLYTAVIGGLVAISIVTPLSKIIKKNN